MKLYVLHQILAILFTIGSIVIFTKVMWDVIWNRGDDSSGSSGSDGGVERRTPPPLPSPSSDRRPLRFSDQSRTPSQRRRQRR